jgi:hypothetical protein
MKMDALHGNAVDSCFGLREAAEDVHADPFDFRIEFAVLDQLADLFPRALRFVFGADDVKLRGADRVNRFFGRLNIKLEGWDFL